MGGAVPNERSPSVNKVPVIKNNSFSVAKEVSSQPFIPRPPDPETGYPCCLNKIPCKHWVWDNGKVLWVNSLTGKEREEL